MSATAKKFPESKPKENVGPGGRSLYYKNAGLFSDPFLDQLNNPTAKHPSFIMRGWETEGVAEFSETYEWMLDTWAQLKEILPRKSEAQLEEMWIRPIFKLLGWEYEVQTRLEKWGKTEIPDYSLFESRQTYLKSQKCKSPDAYFEHVSAVADAKQMGINLDGSKLDKSNPSYQIVNYLHATGKEWGILTDGRYWRLYSTRARSKYSAFYEVDVERFLNERDDQQFKYFFNLFRKDAFVKDSASNQSFLDVLFENGERYAREVETKLKTRAFDVVELICQGFVEGSSLSSSEDLREVYTHSLYYLFRLMFILNCEAKGLLNVYKTDSYYPYSLRALCQRIKQEHESNQAWSNRFTSYGMIEELFALLRSGDASVGIHGFGTEVFSSGDEAFYRAHRIPDSFLNRVLLELAFSEEKKGKDLLFIDYKRLAADHLGSIFEGLLEFRLELPASGKSKKPELVNSSGERKTTGSYYTPQYVVDYIVKETLSPLVENKSVDEILQLKVIDPAMGSGHFLLGAVRFLEEAVHTSIATRKESGIDPQTVKWRILHSCIYGSDLNPLAVELAKFSLWMETANAGYELEPLSDQLICCDSLLDSKKWSSAFSGIQKSGGFSAVIGNPPYVRQEYLSSRKSEFEAQFKVFHAMTDLYAYFIEKGVSDLCKGGRFGMIVANKWMRAEYGKPLRSWIKNNGLEKIVDFGDLPVFPGVAAYPVIIFAEKGTTGKAIDVAALKELDQDCPLSKQVAGNLFSIKKNDLAEDGWSILDPSKQKILGKLTDGARPLGEYIGDSAFRGILTGCNEAFVVSELDAKSLIKQDPRSKEILVPFAAGKEVKRYSNITPRNYLILALRGIEIDKYPGVKKYLSKLALRGNEWVTFYGFHKSRAVLG